MDTNKKKAHILKMANFALLQFIPELIHLQRRWSSSGALKNINFDVKVATKTTNFVRALYIKKAYTRY